MTHDRDVPGDARDGSRGGDGPVDRNRERVQTGGCSPDDHRIWGDPEAEAHVYLRAEKAHHLSPLFAVYAIVIVMALALMVVSR